MSGRMSGVEIIALITALVPLVQQLVKVAETFTSIENGSAEYDKNLRDIKVRLQDKSITLTYCNF
jgi:hypothetical protein